jgi:two-component system sensor histidine kinase RegB
LFFIGLTALSNVVLLWWVGRARPASRGLWGAVLSLDVLILTGLLHATGGPSNPFAVLYLVSITLAAILLGAAWTWCLTALSVAAYGGLFLVHLPLMAHEHTGHWAADFTTHLWGMWLAYTLTAVLTASFVVNLTAAIRRRDEEIAVIREQAARSERLAGMTTLAAGVAHELGSPLATIAVAAEELERSVSQLPDAHAATVMEDARLIRSQLERCRKVIEEMSAAAGGVIGEAPASVPLQELILSLRQDLPPVDAKRVQVVANVHGAALVPHRAFARALHSLLRNALDASPSTSPVRVSVETAADRSLRVVVADSGHGMSAEVLARATDPFFTTKPPGRGMGMGLFLARALVEQLGGRLMLTSTAGVGTSAILELPATAMPAQGGDDFAS